MTSLELVTPRAEHAASLFSDVRQVDREEWIGGTLARDPLRYLQAALEEPGAYCRGVLLDGRCLCIWGVHDLPGGDGTMGQAWLIATNEALRHVVGIHRFQRPSLAEIDLRWDALAAWSYERNTVHHQWMRRMGFKLHSKTNLAFGLPYLLFIRRH